MAAHLRHLVQLLRSPTSKSPSSEAVAHIGALHDRTVPKQTEKMLACRKGCSHCCSQMVVVTAPEDARLAADTLFEDFIASGPSIPAQTCGCC